MSAADGADRGARRAAVLGRPVAHSLSPALHNAAYEALGIAGRWSYTAQECDERQLPAFLDGCDASWAGLSLTMPLKRTAMSLVDWCDELGTEVGGINTVVFRGGSRLGYNTDVEGIVAALSEAGIGAARSVAIAGAGATAASALAAVRRLGAAEPVTVLARDLGRTAELAEAGERMGVGVRLRPLAQVQEHLDVDLFVSTLPAGAADALAPAVARSRAGVFDVVYTHETRLVEATTAAGRPSVGGFPMLLHQACAQVRLMTGCQPPVEAMRRAGQAELLAAQRLP